MLLGALSGGTSAVDVEVVGGGRLVFVALGGAGGTSVALGAVGMVGMIGEPPVGCLSKVFSGAIGVLEIRGACLPARWGRCLKASSLAL